MPPGTATTPRAPESVAFASERSTASRAEVGDVTLFYDTFGDPAATPLLLIMGLGAQMIFWPEPLCEALAEAGHYVVRFDNRDIGRSSRWHEAPRPSVAEALLLSLLGRSFDVPYTLRDMADDSLGLLDHLNIERAHVVGVSMGGMIAQVMALESDRVDSLTSVMSGTGDPWVSRPRLRAARLLMRRRRTETPESYAEQIVELFRVIGSPGFPLAEDEIRDRALRAHARGASAAGTLRQLLAVLAGGDRTERLRGLEVPTLVIHGTEDPLIPAAAGRATADAIPGADLMLIEGMGHDLPRALWGRFADAITRHVRRYDCGRLQAAVAPGREPRKRATRR